MQALKVLRKQSCKLHPEQLPMRRHLINACGSRMIASIPVLTWDSSGGRNQRSNVGHSRDEAPYPAGEAPVVHRRKENAEERPFKGETAQLRYPDVLVRGFRWASTKTRQHVSLVISLYTSLK